MGNFFLKLLYFILIFNYLATILVFFGLSCNSKRLKLSLTSVFDIFWLVCALGKRLNHRNHMWMRALVNISRSLTSLNGYVFIRWDMCKLLAFTVWVFSLVKEHAGFLHSNGLGKLWVLNKLVIRILLCLFCRPDGLQFKLGTVRNFLLNSQRLRWINFLFNYLV